MIENPAIIGALAGFVTASIAVAGFYYARRTYRDEQVAKFKALELATQGALQEAAEATNAVRIHQAAFHLYQLNQAEELRKLVTSDNLKHIETRIMDAIRDLSRSSVDAVNNLSRRIDDIATKGRD